MITVLSDKKAVVNMALQTQRLHTPFEKDLGEVPFASYPRPQMVRDSYYCLNGTWRLTLKNKQREVSSDILVPFPPQSAVSGFMYDVTPDDLLIYERTFTLPPAFIKDTVLLHFGAVDQTATVFVNDCEVAFREGGYLPFSCDITPYLISGDNRLRVEVRDPLDTDLPYGKQSLSRGGMWYTPVSGIWQTVWCESVPREYIRSITITPTLDSVTIETVGGEREKRLTVHTDSGDIVKTFDGDSVTLSINDPKHWTPETPYLYHFVLQSGDDEVASYFALRTVSVAKVGKYARLLLNGKPYFMNGLLDQGYYSDGLYLPSSDEGYRFDVTQMKSLGFNTLRKHIKIEPEVFYYECDRLGMLVFQDIVNSGRYHFLLDTALPTIGLKRGISHPPSKRRREVFERHTADTVTHLYNHPCIVYYTLFNEGWGQYDADRLYMEMKALDGSRVWDATSGWFFGKKSDVQSEHVYFKPIKLKPSDRPLVLSEFGGYSCKLPEHSFNLDKTYGYRFFTDTAAFEEALLSLYRDEIASAVANGLCAAILTQVSDVEDETNGLLTYDRQMLKVSPDAMREMNKALQELFEKNLV